MELSTFLARLLGLYMLILAGLWVIQKDQVDAVIKDFIASKGLIFFSEIINIVAGLAIAIGHPVWEFGWKGLISLIAYIMIFQGIMRVAFIDKVQKNAKKFMNSKVFFWPTIGVMVLLGCILTYCGFMTSSATISSSLPLFG